MAINHIPIPLHFEGRYFVLEPNRKNSLSVILKHGDTWIYEIQDNLPVENPVSYTHRINVEEIAASDQISGKMLYRINLGRVIFITIYFPQGQEYRVAIEGCSIAIGNARINNCNEDLNFVKITVNADGTYKENLMMPDDLSPFLQKASVKETYALSDMPKLRSLRIARG